MKNGLEKGPGAIHSPQRITDGEAEKIVKNIGDSRLRTDLDIEHFVIVVDESRSIFIPKRKTMLIKKEGSENARHVEIGDYLKESLALIDVDDAQEAA